MFSQHNVCAFSVSCVHKVQTQIILFSRGENEYSGTQLYLKYITLSIFGQYSIYRLEYYSFMGLPYCIGLLCVIWGI